MTTTTPDPDLADIAARATKRLAPYAPVAITTADVQQALGALPRTHTHAQRVILETAAGRHWHRLAAPDLVMPGTRAWQREVEDGHLSVLVGREPHEDGIHWHLSISHRTSGKHPRPGRYPTWDEIYEARYRFLPDEITVAQLLPPKAEYVNVHATTFHLWELP